MQLLTEIPRQRGPVPIKAAGPADEAAVINTLVLAFSSDPVARWVWQDPHQYLMSMPIFSMAFGGRAFDHGSADCTEDLAGAALWLPPSAKADDDAIVHVLERTVAKGMQDEVFSVLEFMGSCHPAEPHWYLPLIGVDPAYQGKGYGRSLLERALQRCDRDRTPAYLESTNPRNVPLYQRHGFEVLRVIQVGSSPAIFPMLRAARRSARIG